MRNSNENSMCNALLRIKHGSFDGKNNQEEIYLLRMMFCYTYRLNCNSVVIRAVSNN